MALWRPAVRIRYAPVMNLVNFIFCVVLVNWQALSTPLDLTMECSSVDDVVRLLYDNHRQGSVEIKSSTTLPDHPVITWKERETTKQETRAAPSQDKWITYSRNGRLGDNLCSYLHAKWLAYKYNLPLRYRSFPLADQFCLSDERAAKKNHQKSKNRIKIKDESQLNSQDGSALFVVPYFPENTEHIFDHGRHIVWAPTFQVDWEDPEFQAEVRRSLTPKHPIVTPSLPNNCLNVGVHVRRGGGVDSLQERQRVPLKFPPDSYYIQQIERISKIFKNYRLYVYILTDDVDPASIANTYRTALNNPNITFDYRKGNNGPAAHVLEDFFFIPKFDCLVICQSNFSLMASKLADCAVVITPTHPVLINGEVVIDEVKLTFNGKRRVTDLARIK
jgi:hypothetical protein